MQVFVRPLLVCFPHFVPLVRTLITGHFRERWVSIPGGFKDLKTPPQQTRQQQQGNLPHPEVPWTGNSSCSIGARIVQVQEHNLDPNQQLQVGPGFNLNLVMDMAEGATKYPIPIKNDDCPFCLSFHLNGVCTSHCGGRHYHLGLTAIENGTQVV